MIDCPSVPTVVPRAAPWANWDGAILANHLVDAFSRLEARRQACHDAAMPRLDWMFRGRRYEWHVVGGLVVLTIGLGVHGFWSFLASVGDFRSPLHVLYLTAQLFTMNSGAIPAPIPWSLELARILAPSLAAYTAARALLSVFAEQVLLYRVQLLHRHTVICGLGDKGWRLALACRARGDEVVVIELDPLNRQLASAREAELHVLVGDARDSAMLRLAGVDRAARIISVCAVDSVNADIAGKARQLHVSTDKEPLDCIAHVGNLELYGLLKDRELAETENTLFRLDFFNVVERAAHVLLDLHEVRASRHLLMCGWSPLTEALLLTLAQAARLRDPTAPAPHVTLLDADANEHLAAFQARHPGVIAHCVFQALPIGANAPEFFRAAYLFDSNRASCFDAVLVLYELEETSLQVGMTLAHHLRPDNVPIRVASLGNHEITGLFDPNDVWQPVPLLDRACELGSVLGGTHEQLARALHSRYQQNCAAAGETPSSNPSMRQWADIPEYLRESNRLQADHIATKLSLVGFRLAPLTASNEPPITFSMEQIEALAEIEHGRWVDEKRAAGWKLGPQKDDAKKITPHLVAWEDPHLAEFVRARNRDTIRDLPSLLADAGFRLAPMGPSQLK